MNQNSNKKVKILGAAFLLLALVVAGGVYLVKKRSERPSSEVSSLEKEMNSLDNDMNDLEKLNNDKILEDVNQNLKEITGEEKENSNEGGGTAEMTNEGNGKTENVKVDDLEKEFATELGSLTTDLNDLDSLESDNSLSSLEGDLSTISQ